MSITQVTVGALGVLVGVGYLVFVNIQRLKKKTRDMDEAINDLKLLQEVGKDISSKLDMSELLPGIMNAFVRAGKVSKGSLMLYDKEKDLLEIKASVGLSERAKKYVKLKIGEGIAGKVAETGNSILINDTTRDIVYKDFFVGDPKGRPKETLLSLPLIFKGEVLGVITLDSKISGEQFIRNDERLLSILASQSAVSINNAIMYEMAITDALTGLYIRRYFIHRLEQEVEKARRYDRPLSLLFLDIDHFKEFNDTYGHQLGDKALIYLAKIMKRRTRAADICVRYGGEEFIIILPETPKEQAMAMAERLRQDVENDSISAKGNIYKITASIGVAAYSGKIISANELIRESDRRLYQAKEEGRNRVVG